MVNRERIAIDFVCLNVHTGMLWYWDHQGMMDNAEYVKKTLHNEELLYSAGIIPWVNMIVTTETSSIPLDVQWVETIIKYYLQ